jgi:hypothetical protein
MEMSKVLGLGNTKQERGDSEMKQPLRMVVAAEEEDDGYDRSKSKQATSHHTYVFSSIESLDALFTKVREMPTALKD